MPCVADNGIKLKRAIVSVLVAFNSLAAISLVALLFTYRANDHSAYQECVSASVLQQNVSSQRLQKAQTAIRVVGKMSGSLTTNHLDLILATVTNDKLLNADSGFLVARKGERLLLEQEHIRKKPDFDFDVEDNRIVDENEFFDIRAKITCNFKTTAEDSFGKTILFTTEPEGPKQRIFPSNQRNFELDMLLSATSGRKLYALTPAFDGIIWNLEVTLTYERTGGVAFYLAV